MLQDTDGTENVTDNLGLAREVRGVTKDHLGAGLKLHLLDASHGGLDANSLAALGDELIDVGVEHVGTAVDGGETGKALGELAKTVQRVDVRRLSVTGNRVTVEADALNGVGGLALGGEVVIGEVEGHGVANEVLGASLKAELVVDLVHGAGVHVET